MFIKLAMKDIDKLIEKSYKDKVFMLLQIHDELYLKCEKI